MPFDDRSFKLVIFDPPHLLWAGEKSFMKQKYGKLLPSWQKDLKKGFDECMRVLDTSGILIFKWNETQINVNKILKIFNETPIIGHKSGKASKTHWMIFMKQ